MTMVCAVWEPGRPLEFRALTWPQIEALAGGHHGAVDRVSLFRNGQWHLLKLMASDVAALFPDQYGQHSSRATRFVAALGGPVQNWAGTLVVYGIDSIEGGFPETLDDAQRATITDAYRNATGTDPVDTTAA